MKKYSLMIVLMVLLYHYPLKGQSFEIPRYQLSLAYFGENVTNGGIRLGFTSPLNEISKEKDDRGTINKGWVIGTYLTYYKHPRNHKAFMLTGAIGRQRIGTSGFQTTINFEAGYMLSQLDGEVYEWDGSQIVEGSKNSNHIVFGFNGGLGWNFSKKTDLPLSFMLQPHFYFQAPFNTLIAPRMALETKLTYNLK